LKTRIKPILAILVEAISDRATITGIAQAPIHSMVIATIVEGEVTWLGNVGLDKIIMEITTALTIAMVETGETTTTTTETTTIIGIPIATKILIITAIKTTTNRTTITTTTIEITIRIPITTSPTTSMIPN